ncbi:MAG: HlyD family efflux transporter periplasmic adaptor subunit, partial [Paracoccaceae bacterium]
KVAGTVVTLADAFQEGGRVEKGQLLFRVDQADAKAAVDVASADLAEAESELRDATRALELARDEVTAAQDQAQLREQALARQKNVKDRGFGSDALVEEAALAASSAQQAVLARRQALASAETRVEQARTQLSRQKINLADARRRLADTELFAEFSGTLSGVAIVEGGLVSVNQQVAQLIDPEALEVSFRLSTPQYTRLLDDSGALIPADVAVVLDANDADLQAHGTVTREGAAVQEGQTGRLIFARLDQARGFRPGDFVTVHVQEPALEDVATLPATALDSDNRVLVLGRDDRLETAQVTLLRRQGDDVIVRAPALEGHEVVDERSPLLGEGIKVSPIRPEADAAGALPGAPDLLELTAERRARLIAFVEASRTMPKEAKDRIVAQLSQDRVPATTVQRLESRMGG